MEAAHHGRRALREKIAKLEQEALDHDADQPALVFELLWAYTALQELEP